MTLKIRTLLIVGLVSIITSCAVNQPITPVVPDAPMPATEVESEYFLNSSEYKLLLSPEKFVNMSEGFEAYWQIINEIADAEGIPVLASEHPMELKHKEVSFFDTKNLDLRKNRFLLRQKLKYKGEELQSNYEFAVKYRHPDPVTALSMDLTLAEGYVSKYGEIELESDIVYYSSANGSTHTSYTVSNSIKLAVEPEMTLGTFAAIYPALKTIDIPAETPLSLVSGISADEWMVVPGKLEFGDGLFGRMDMTVWILEGPEGKISVPEFSFDHPFTKDHDYDPVAMERCTTFINKLNDKYPEWVVPGELKAATLFNLKK
ncbi:MAG: hypothetical protein HQ506_08795 [Candidatus Marinimicrobia bacterium]|nr:hypothetical protein [Candidatus Neomarinimicrobiota bacterium]